MHPTATLLHNKVTYFTERVQPTGPRAKSLLAGNGNELEQLLALRVWTRAFCLGLQLYENGCSKGASVVSLTRVNLPYLVLK